MGRYKADGQWLMVTGPSYGNYHRIEYFNNCEEAFQALEKEKKLHPYPQKWHLSRATGPQRGKHELWYNRGIRLAVWEGKIGIKLERINGI